MVDILFSRADQGEHSRSVSFGVNLLLRAVEVVSGLLSLFDAGSEYLHICTDGGLVCDRL